MSAILHSLWGAIKPVEAKKPEPVRALPASWYNSEEMYQLERRAIFSKRWQLITHRNRLPNAGDFLELAIVGYEFVLVRDRKGVVNGFHNISRNGSRPVIEKQSESTETFVSGHHEWSYDLDNKTTKAPKCGELEDLNVSQNGVFPIHVKTDSCGFIWVNLDSNTTPEVPFEQDFDGVDSQERYQVYNFDNYELHHEYEMQGPYNWKILSDNFNECYHCPTTHPDIPQMADIDTHDVQGIDGWIRHQTEQTEEQKRDGLAIASSYFYPNVSISVLPHFIMLQRFLPNGPGKSSMHYQIFKNKNSTEEQFHRIADMYARVVSEDKVLCERVQNNLNQGIFNNGQLHPRLERGPLYFQKLQREVIWEHVQKERAAKKEIWPVGQVMLAGAGAGSYKRGRRACSD